MLAAGAIPTLVLLEDCIDLCDFLEFTDRTVPRSMWADEAVQASQEKELDNIL